MSLQQALSMQYVQPGLLQMDKLTKSPFRHKSRSLMHPCKHKLMLKMLGRIMKQDIQMGIQSKAQSLKSDPVTLNVF